MLESESQDVIINLFCRKNAKCFEFSPRRAVHHAKYEDIVTS